MAIPTDKTGIVMKALEHIDPVGLAYEDWLRIGLSLWRGEYDGEVTDAYGIWVLWSSQDPERFKERVCEQKWRRFKLTKVTLGTLFHFAKLSGYVSDSGVSWRYRRHARTFGAEKFPKAPLHASRRGGIYTLNDLWFESTWISVRQGKGLGYAKDETWIQYLHSADERDGGVRLARHGGTHQGEGWHVPHWETYWEIRDNVCPRFPGTMPALCLSGDDDCPAPFDVAVIDFDYRPKGDTPDRKGRIWRDDVGSDLIALGAPTYVSRSKKGFHSLIRVDLDEWFNEQNAYPEKPWNGARLEVFPAGFRHSATIFFERPMGHKHDLNTEIPLVKLDTLKKIWEIRQ